MMGRMRLHACTLAWDILSYILTNKYSSHASLCNATAEQKCVFWSWRNKNATFSWPQEGARETLWQSPDSCIDLKNYLFDLSHVNISECITLEREKPKQVSSVLNRCAFHDMTIWLLVLAFQTSFCHKFRSKKLQFDI